MLFWLNSSVVICFSENSSLISFLSRIGLQARFLLALWFNFSGKLLQLIWLKLWLIVICILKNTALFIYTLDKPNTKYEYVLNTKTQNIFCCVNENQTTFLYTLTGGRRKQKEKKKVFSFKVYTQVECY